MAMLIKLQTPNGVTIASANVWVAAILSVMEGEVRSRVIERVENLDPDLQRDVESWMTSIIAEMEPDLQEKVAMEVKIQDEKAREAVENMGIVLASEKDLDAIKVGGL